MKDEITETAPRCTYKRCLLFALIFLILTAVSRVLDTLAAAWDADVMVDPSRAGAALIASVAVSLIAVGLSGGATVFASIYGEGKVPFAAASLFTAIVFADRTYYVLYSVATKVKTFTSGAGPEAYVRLTCDALFLAAAYFLTAYAGVRVARKKGGSVSCTLPAFVFASVLTAGQFIYQTYVTVRFFASYDDVTAVEKSGIAADYFFILLKYGVLTFGAAVVFYYVLKRIFEKRQDKKEKNR